MCGIYKITQKSTGIFYIGKSKHIERRWEQHRNCNLPGWHHELFQNPVDFSFEVLEECEENELTAREAYWIKELKAVEKGFNIQGPSTAEDSYFLIHSPAAKIALNDALGMSEFDVQQIIKWEPLYTSYKEGQIDSIVIDVKFYAEGHGDTVFNTHLLIINQGEITSQDYDIIVQNYCYCAVLRKYKNTFIHDKRFEEFLNLDSYQNLCYNKM